MPVIILKEQEAVQTQESQTSQITIPPPPCRTMAWSHQWDHLETPWRCSLWFLLSFLTLSEGKVHFLWHHVHWNLVWLRIQIRSLGRVSGVDPETLWKQRRCFQPWVQELLFFISWMEILSVFSHHFSYFKFYWSRNFHISCKWWNRDWNIYVHVKVFPGQTWVVNTYKYLSNFL